MSAFMGAIVDDGTTTFRVRAPHADKVVLCLFNDADAEDRIAMERDPDGVHWLYRHDGDLTGQLYGYRAHGTWDPEQGHWFDPVKLLVDPHATQLDRRFRGDARLTQYGAQTGDLVPRARVMREYQECPKRAVIDPRGGLIYELNVRGFTMQHPEVPDAMRGTVAALAHPAVIAHLRALNVAAVELMPIIAWIDEPHLGPRDLRNLWGYNPVAMMALDPGLCPGGVPELRRTVEALHDAGIGVLLDLVFNHTGESDAGGNILSLRGLDASAYATTDDGVLINDSGCGNTVDFGQEWIQELALDTMRHFVARCGVDGFRFDLAPIMARSPGFEPDAQIFASIADDPWLSDRVMIAEPWDIGPGGYQLGQFPASWLEWNDKFRDDVRRFWLQSGPLGPLATRAAGSADIFGAPSRSVNFLAAHDGYTLADCTAYEHRHNEANGEDNRDGHGENYSNNFGVEGPADDADILAARDAALRGMLVTLFVSTGTIMLTAGDEFGRTQHGNNNAYCQDNPIGWVDWAAMDEDLLGFVQHLSADRAGQDRDWTVFPEPGQWTRPDGETMRAHDWDNGETRGVAYTSDDGALSFRLIRE